MTSSLRPEESARLRRSAGCRAGQECVGPMRVGRCSGLERSLGHRCQECRPQPTKLPPTEAGNLGARGITGLRNRSHLSKLAGPCLSRPSPRTVRRSTFSTACWTPAVGSTNARGLSSFWVGGQNDMMFTTDWVTVAPGDVVIGRMTVNPQGNGLVSCTTEFDGYSRRPCGQTTGSPPSNSRQTLPNCEVKSRTETEQICKLTANRRKPVLSTK